jgi:hypothetical protein
LREHMEELREYRDIRLGEEQLSLAGDPIHVGRFARARTAPPPLHQTVPLQGCQLDSHRGAGDPEG